ncbi:hypothetical protein C8J56DRAFT_1041942 [Mycena floridula]|nr:hypothetical protein C8J56DRAFT_1041942 [Mycena floridula]
MSTPDSEDFEIQEDTGNKLFLGLKYLASSPIRLDFSFTSDSDSSKRMNDWLDLESSQDFSGTDPKSRRPVVMLDTGMLSAPWRPSSEIETPLLGVWKDYYGESAESNPLSPNDVDSSSRRRRTSLPTASNFQENLLQQPSIDARVPRLNTKLSRSNLIVQQQHPGGVSPYPTSATTRSNALVTLAWTGELSSTSGRITPNSGKRIYAPVSSKSSPSSSTHCLPAPNPEEVDFSSWKWTSARRSPRPDMSPRQTEPASSPLPLRTDSLTALSRFDWGDPITTSARPQNHILQEIYRTELSYLSSLNALACRKTSTPPPPLILTYLPALIDVSRELIVRMSRSPSAPGIAGAFLTLQHQLEAAFVGWSGIVGTLFQSPDRGQESTSIGFNARASFESLTTRAGSWTKKGGFKSKNTSSNSVNRLKEESRADNGGLPSVRDLAIAPIQRCMRYVMLFEDLYSNTPPGSAPHNVVEHAMSAAISIARKCDKAQDNATFLRPIQ